jgi:hypothetical protein
MGGGKGLMLSLDPKTTSVVWGNGWKMRLDKFIRGPEPNRLRVSQDVVVSHILKDGAELATTIHVLGARTIMAWPAAPEQVYEVHLGLAHEPQRHPF